MADGKTRLRYQLSALSSLVVRLSYLAKSRRFPCSLFSPSYRLSAISSQLTSRFTNFPAPYVAVRVATENAAGGHTQQALKTLLQ